MLTSASNIVNYHYYYQHHYYYQYCPWSLTVTFGVLRTNFWLPWSSPSCFLSSINFAISSFNCNHNRKWEYFTSKNVMFPFSMELKEKCSQGSKVTSDLKIPSCRHISRYFDIFMAIEMTNSGWMCSCLHSAVFRVNFSLFYYILPHYNKFTFND